MASKDKFVRASAPVTGVSLNGGSDQKPAPGRVLSVEEFSNRHRDGYETLARLSNEVEAALKAR